MRQFGLLLLCLIIGVYSGCNIQAFELRLDIQGKVTNLSNGLAISGAKVVLSRVKFGDTVVLDSDITDDQGWYEIVLEFDDEHDCEDTQLVLHAEKGDYIKQYVTYNEITSRYVQCCTGVQTFDFKLVKF